MASQHFCPCCRTAELVQGTLQSTGTTHFRPFGVPFLTLRTADISVRGGMCSKCGVITLLGDLEKLRLILETPTAQEATRTTAATKPTGPW